MRYYVTADVHGFYDKFMTALTETGFFEDKEPHKLIICGDIYDRGNGANKLQEFILDLMKKDQIILIRGNHEDLAIDLLHRWHQGSYYQIHHHTNGTVDTVCQITGYGMDDINMNPEEVGRAFLKNPFIREIIPYMVDYYETDNYIFVHGWIPCTQIHRESGEYEYIYDGKWRDSDKMQWSRARWYNGMEAAHAGVIEEGKTIVCGHWHSSFGHSRYENNGSEDGPDADFKPYYGKGIIALDACTALSKSVNCILIED